jgi:uncharacterized phiE125 gp8 family phage protein
LSYSLKLIYAPTIEPVTVAEVKLHTHIGSDVSEDSLITTWIKTARQLAENYQRRAYIRQTWELSYDYFPNCPINIPRPPLINIEWVKYYGTDNTEYTHALTNFIIDSSTEPARICLGYQLIWPSVILRPMDGFKIRYNCGYSSSGEELTTTEAPDSSHVPEYVKDAIMLYCAYRYENRAAEVGQVPRQFYDILTPERIWKP